MDELLEESAINKLKLNGYQARSGYSEIYIHRDIKTGLNTKEVELVCEKQMNNIIVKHGSEISHGEWYDLWKNELEYYQKDINNILMNDGIWFM